ncbi:hypothetical protein B0I27_1061 [Arcticibacter pallidicorallinus]|uniref:YXWGXW repeat-containing protein n=1 Tax=Arcticibacter pallidicorallinus TaxID=1259464 RepID=A0A2T0U2V5_9SPHI|nr:DUF6600 domain-containing protein [Arcticibacter pallidicorallinus]PRY52243.1 hypothetical protein B0I27_1061 [Arcticibacter pallidicorallinus]
MKDLKRVLMLLILGTMFSSLSSTASTLSQPGASVSFQTFYDELSPYGQWINYQDHGRVWIPNVEEGFQPYGTRGHWVVTDYGNTWVSDYDWGWAPFHYGRWLFDDYYGWIWVPGSEWGPAWVNWRSGGGYYGWAPLGPGLDINININIPLARWIFVPQRYITHRSVYNYHVPRNRYSNFYGHTTVINNIYVRDNRRYFAGPQRREMERYTRGRIPVHQVHASNRPGRTVAERGAVRVYRPDLNGRNDRDRGNAVDRPARGNAERYGNNNNNRPTNDNRNRDNTRPSTTRPGQDNNSRPNSGEIRNRENPAVNRGNRDTWTNRPGRSQQAETRPSGTLPESRPSGRNTESSERRSAGAGRIERRPERNIPGGQTERSAEAQASQRATRSNQAEARQRAQAPQRATPQMERAPRERSQSSDNSRSNRGSSSGERPSRGSGRLTRG